MCENSSPVSLSKRRHLLKELCCPLHGGSGRECPPLFSLLLAKPHGACRRTMGIRAAEAHCGGCALATPSLLACSNRYKHVVCIW